MNDDLPEGWASAALGDLVQPSSEKVEPEDVPPEFPYLSLEHIGSGMVRILKHGLALEVRSTKTRFRPGDVLYGKLRPYLNKVAVPSFDGICSTDILVFPASESVDSKYLQGYLSTPEVVAHATHHSTGVQLPRVSFKALADLAVPLPPLAEQRRIVTKIEALFVRVGTARERLMQAATTIEQLRRAIIACACSGNLTQDLRSDQQDGGEDSYPDGWSIRAFGDLLLELRNGVPPKPQQNPPGVPILRINAVRPGHVSLETERYLPNSENLVTQFAIRDGDLLFTRYNGSLDLLGVCGMVRSMGSRVMLYPDKLIRARTNEQLLLPAYAEIYFRTPDAREGVTARAKSSAGQQGISGADLKRQPVALPPLHEQREIVRRVDALLVLANAIEKRVNASLTRAEKLPQSIFAQAFAGGLVPTEAELARRGGCDYETALVLLSRIRAERAEQPWKRNRNRKASRGITNRETKSTTASLQKHLNSANRRGSRR